MGKGRGKFYIVQSRPITTLAPAVSEDETMQARETENEDHKNVEAETEYASVFEAENVPLLFMSLHIKNVPWDGLVLYKDGKFAQYTKRCVIAEVGQRGISLLSDPVYAVSVVEEANQYLEQFESSSRKAIAKGKFVKADIELFAKTAIGFLDAYTKTDHVLTDMAAQLEDPGSAISKNLTYISEHKNTLREGMNRAFFESGAVYQKFLDVFATQLEMDADDLHWLFADELNVLCDGGAIPAQDITARKEAYAIINSSGEQEYIFGSKATSFYDEIVGTNTPTMSSGVLRGAVAHPGKGSITATVFVMSPDYGDFAALTQKMDAMEQGMILVSQTTTLEMMPALRKAAAIVTDIGGFLSHAAITARELNIPCVVGTEVGSKVFHDGDLVEVDADAGAVRIVRRSDSEGGVLEQAG